MPRKSARVYPYSIVKIAWPEPDFCSVCLDEITNKCTLPCKHAFCKPCITEWLRFHNNCPLCRMTVKVSRVRRVRRRSFFRRIFHAFGFRR